LDLPDFIFPRFKKNYLIFFDDLNKFTDVDFDFKRFLDKFRSKSNRMIVLSTCKSGDGLDTVKSKSMEFFRRFEIVDLNNYPLSEAYGEHLEKDAGVGWKPEQFNGTPGSVVLDDKDMKKRYRHLDDRQKAILRTCKLLRSANIFMYEKSYKKSLEFNPDVTVTHYNIGNLLDDQGRYDAAEEEYRGAIRAYPDYAESHTNLGIPFLATERPEEAEKEFGIAKELFKNQGRDEYVKKMEELLSRT